MTKRINIVKKKYLFDTVWMLCQMYDQIISLHMVPEMNRVVNNHLHFEHQSTCTF